MEKRSQFPAIGFDQHFMAALVIALALVVFAVTWVGIKESRSDSLQLLVMQGTAFTEALAQAAENAIASEGFIDHVIYLRYSDIVALVAGFDPTMVSDWQLIQLSLDHDLNAIYLFDSSAILVASGTTRDNLVGLPEFVTREAEQLLANPEDRFALLLDENDGPATHYYLEITNDLNNVIILVADALYYVDALRKTQIGYLAQNMAREAGVEYIIYQSTDGIVFSSRKPGRLLAIQSDPFLTDALESDSIMHRLYTFQERDVLELVRPFSSEEYPFGVLRIGLSLEGYYSISKGFNRQMISLAGVLFVLLLVALLYLNSRRRRKEIAREYTHMKTITDRIFDEMRTGVAAMDSSGVIMLANDAFERVFGVSDSVGRNWDDVVQCDKVTFVEISSKSLKSAENEISIGVGDVQRTLLVAVSGLEFGVGELSGVVAVVYDVTRLKEFERQSARKERLSEMGNLAAGVAHEIRNPLNTISIAAQRLASEFDPGEQQESYQAITSHIRTETKRLNEIITRFLALARGEKKRYQPIRLDEFIMGISRFYESEACELGIKLSVEVEPDLIIDSDSDALKQVFSNLFNNAKEALGGNPGTIMIKARSYDQFVEILFSDSGPGIDADICDRVFTPYFTTKDGGTGLGLPTVYKIVSDLGGEVRVRDTESRGAVFMITLPL